MSQTPPDDTVRAILALSAYEAGWDGRAGAAANPASLVLATALAVEAASLGLVMEASLHANGNAVLTREEGDRRASIQCHPDGVAAACVTGGFEWDGEERCVTLQERRYLISWIARCLEVTVREPAAAFQVRRLDWSVEGEGDERTYYVDTILGRYAAWTRNDVGRMSAPGNFAPIKVGWTARDARAAAQSDFEHRVRSAVVTEEDPSGARPSPDSVASVETLAPLPGEDDPFFRKVLGDEVYQPTGGIPSIKHMHPLHMKPVFESVRGTAAADVMAALLFRGMVTWNNGRHAWEAVARYSDEVVALKKRLADAERRLAAEGPDAPVTAS